MKYFLIHKINILSSSRWTNDNVLMTVQVNDSFRNRGGKKRILKSPINNLLPLQTVKINAIQQSERREKNDPWKWEGRIQRYRRNLLLQCAQKSDTAEMSGSCSNTFVGKAIFCVWEAQLKPKNMVECGISMIIFQYELLESLV